MQRPYAAFDIDGTIIRWQLYHAIADGLSKRGIIDEVAYQKVKTARMDWKHRSTDEGFRDYELLLIEIFNESLAGIAVDVFEEISADVFNTYKNQVYTYTRDLIHNLKAKNYLLFAISGSPAAVVSQFADFYEFDDFAATDYAAEHGHFTGEKQLTIGHKQQLLQSLIIKHNAHQKDSIAVGDTEGDIDMLALADNPIAFNPSRQLFQHAQSQGWKIVVERKNMVYELEASNGTYLLA